MAYIAVDFDGTCVTHDYPLIGKELNSCVETLKDLVEHDHKLVLNTMRSGKTLDAAVNWFKTNGIELFGINRNPTQDRWTSSPKAYAELYIDDAALGCPLIYDPVFHSRHFVNWLKVREYLISNQYIS